jgi:hypothetical protein
MANYDPMSSSLARANVVGRTTENIGNYIVNFASQIAEISKQRGIESKIEMAHKESVNRFVTELTEADPSISKEKAMITAMRRLPGPIKGISNEDNLKSLLSASVNADKYIEEFKKTATAKADQQKAATAAQSVTQPQRSYGLERDTGRGFTEQNITKEIPAPQYQEQAIGAYGDLSARGEAPIQTAEQLQQQPSIAALPKTPEQEKPLTAYQKWEMKFKEDEAKRKSIEDKHKEGKGDAKDRDDNVKWAAGKETDYLAGAKSGTEKASKLKQAIIKLKTQMEKGQPPILEMDDVSELRGMGFDGKTDLESLSEELDSVNKIINSSKAEAKKFGAIAKSVAKGGSVSESYAKFRSDQINIALDAIKRNVAPGYSGGTEQLLSWLPEELKQPIREKIAEAKNRGLTEAEIVRGLTLGRK